MNDNNSSSKQRSRAAVAILPAKPPPPFPPVQLLSARRLAGAAVILPTTTTTESITSTDGCSSGSSWSHNMEQQQQQHRPPVLQRRASIAGNILCVDNRQYFWLQRKIRTTASHGSVRAGFCLKDPQQQQQHTIHHQAAQQGAANNNGEDDNDGGGDDNNNDGHPMGMWEVAVIDKTQQQDDSATATAAADGSSSGNWEEPQVQMVAIRIESRAAALDDSTELAALQWVAAHLPQQNNDDDCGSYDDDDDAASAQMVLQSPVLWAAADTNLVYTVTPYDCAVSSSLFDYCCAQPDSVLSEDTARGFFRQIIKGLETLRSMQLCHGNLSLESVILRRLKRRSNDAAMDTGDAADDDNDKGYYYCCTITEFGSALRIPFADDDDDDGSTYHLLEPQPLLGARSHHSQYIAPELWSGGNSRSSKSNDENSNSVVPFDGFAVDLWAAGVMLLAMLLGSDALFVAPVLEDRAFQQICVHGHLKEYVHYQAKRRAEAGRTPATTTPSALISDAALDLLQRMLRADPKDRLTLAQVQVHPWVVGVAPHAL